jgi:hypothetical protein
MKHIDLQSQKGLPAFQAFTGFTFKDQYIYYSMLKKKSPP